jgi:hypothetical protein
MDRERLLGGETPLRLEPTPEIDSAEPPIGGVPGCALALHIVGSAWDEPAIHHPQQEALLEQPLPMRSGQIARPDGSGVLTLELGENFE